MFFRLLFGVWFVLCGFSFASHVCAWNAEGHRVVAAIAWQHLTPAAQARFDASHPLLDHPHMPSNFIDASVWLDTLRHHPKLSSKTKRALGQMHYIDLPYYFKSSNHQTWTDQASLHRYHGLMAYQQAHRRLLYADVHRDLEHVIYLRMLVHLVADLHQPLHAVTRISQQFPKGDQGGNQIRLSNNPISRNLHTYWDKGGGLLITRFSTQEKARVLLKQYPCDLQHAVLDPMEWIAESHVYAQNIAYDQLPKQMKQSAYQAMVYDLSGMRLAQAGCRLAKVLNRIEQNGVPIVV